MVTVNYDHDDARKVAEDAPQEPKFAQDLKIVNVLNTYRQEAAWNRMGGLNPRDQKWEHNLHLYWNRYDFSRKASWQSQETMPEVPSFVDRFASSLKEALVATPNSFYAVVDPVDKEGDLTRPIKRMTDAWLSICGQNVCGTYLSFDAVFEEQVKQGAMMGMNSVVTWKGDRKQGRVAIDGVDPRNTWLDHTGRNLYRVRRIEIDQHEIMSLAEQKDGAGKPIYDLQALKSLTSWLAHDAQKQQEEASGIGAQVISNRRPVTLDEYVATVIDDVTGKVIAHKALMVVANEQFLIRGPEKNPFWHEKDWMVFTPLVHTPQSVYGRTYMEDFGDLAQTFNELTNLILDAVRMSSLKAFVCVPEMLLNPEQVNGGIEPFKLFKLDQEFKADDFLKAIDLGAMPPEVIQIWSQMKNELREAADVNEVGLGQFAPKGRTSVAEIEQTQQSSNALIRSIAQSIETRWLNPTLDLVWKTGLQHVSRNDDMIRAAAGDQMFEALYARRKELIARPITFQARGISMLMQKSKTLRSVLNIMSIISQSPELAAAFLQRIDLNRLVNLLFELSDVDLRRLEPTAREKAIGGVVSQFQQAQQNAQGQLQARGQSGPGQGAQRVAQAAGQGLGIAA